VIALDIERFQPLAEFNARMEQFVAELKAVPTAKGFDEVFYPGEMEANNNPAQPQRGDPVSRGYSGRSAEDRRRDGAGGSVTSKCVTGDK
jgi:LDH2 family malate/lactate/ureidoglycolate dehydrogenase